MARPKLEIDADQVKKLAAIQCTMTEIACVMGCSVDTLERRFADTIKEGREQGKMSLRRKQYEVAMGGHVSMLIWLGKQHLNQSDAPAELTDVNERQKGLAILEMIRKVIDDPRNERTA